LSCVGPLASQLQLNNAAPPLGHSAFFFSEVPVCIQLEFDIFQSCRRGFQIIFLCFGVARLLYVISARAFGQVQTVGKLSAIDGI
jgi:hypothetical protein